MNDFLNVLLLESESISKEIVELLVKLNNSKNQSLSTILNLNEIHNQQLTFLCDYVDDVISNSSMLIHSVEELNVDIDSVERLTKQIQQINQILDIMETQ
jgi:chemotaxis signal transduction protein